MPPILKLIYVIYIVLKKFEKVRRADYTDQEVGIVYSLKKSILRISIDGTLPYGFMSKYQSLNAKDGITSELIFEPAVTIYVRLRKSDVDIIESMIAAYADSGLYREVNRRADMLSLNEAAFHKNLNSIAEAFVENDQIRNAATAKSVSLDLLHQRYKDLTSGNKEKLRKWIELSTV